MTENTKTDEPIVTDNDRVYQGLGYLHGQDHSGDDCFCTTEISGVYRIVLDEINKLINSEVNQVLDRLKVRLLGALYPLDDSEREWNKKLEAEW